MVFFVFHKQASTEPPSEDGGELLGASAASITPQFASTEPPSEDGGERHHRNGRGVGAVVLQRSRHPKTAESPQATVQAAFGDPSFNGAAIRRRRRGVPVAEPDLLGSERFNGAAIRRRRRAQRGRGARGIRGGASTEPPSEDGGENAQVITGFAGFIPLQRSRHPKTAESLSGDPDRLGRAPASTEPPSEDGGENGDAMNLPPPSSGFNGAAIRRRRRGGLRVERHVRKPRASTEPPSEDGGESVIASRRHAAASLLQRSRHPKTAESAGRLHRASGRLGASTEPPSEDGGEHPRFWQGHRWPRRFNGAAIRRRRRGVPDICTARPITPRFNGAAIRRRRRARGPQHHRGTPPRASTEPPSEDGGEVMPRFAILSGREGASTEPPSEDGGEFSEPVIVVSRDATLQRSRHPKTAERPEPMHHAALLLMPLQRSRHPKTAERPIRPSSFAPSCNRFNGAAIRRRRRAWVPKGAPLPIPGASTEPPSEDGGELRVRRGNLARRDGASTEPPSEDGGEQRPQGRKRRGPQGFNGAAIRRRRRAADHGTADQLFGELQRSRHPKTAERAGALAVVRGLGALQRSRHPKTAERARFSPLRPWHPKASTEPPSEDGGERVLRAIEQVRLPRFNGAAIRRRRRDAPVARMGLRGIDASTEPPSEDGGERSFRGRTRQSSRTLQRSRHPKTAESAPAAGAHQDCRGSFNGAAIRRRRRVAALMPVIPVIVALQRSRHPKTAERSWGGCAHWRPRRSFNGAAIRRRRRAAAAPGRARPVACFNGAAIRRRRRAAAASREASESIALQRSRHPKTAERASHPRFEEASFDASTEPPSEDGGEDLGHS